jgi:hypothetical protein
MARGHRLAFLFSSILAGIPARAGAVPEPGATAAASADPAAPPPANPQPDPGTSPQDPPATPDAPPPPAGEPAPPPATTDAKGAEVIEIHGAAPAPAGTISIDAQVARKTAGALGEPFRVLALLPGVTTSIAASGYPIIRGTLPGESRFSFDGIEIPMLYHLLLGNQVIHPAFIGDLELRAGLPILDMEVEL